MNRWLSLHIGGQKWSVYLVSRKSKFLDNSDGERLHGSCHYDTCRIFISKELGEQVLEDTLLHELMHAVFYVSGGTSVIEGAMPEADSIKAEEHLIRCVTPVFHRLLKDLEFTFPKVS